jgi:ABC-type transport system involved in Fe-S cluster assembly fused permease/ATPase subunit
MTRGAIRGNIEFEKVSFWYESNTPVIKELSFHGTSWRDYRAGRF